MASIVYNPSNAQPESVSVKTGAYSIPAGYYAYVTANCDSTDTFSIGGVVALQGNASTAQSITTASVSAVSSTATSTVSYTVPTGYYFQGQGWTFSPNPTGTVGVGGLSVGRPNNTGLTTSALVFGTTIYAGSGDVVLVTDSGVSVTITGVSIRPFSIATLALQGTNVSGDFWVSAGTALTTSGGRYTVTLYKNIT